MMARVLNGIMRKNKMNDFLNKLRDLAETLLIETGLKINQVEFEWLDTSTVSEKRSILKKVKINVETK